MQSVLMFGANKYKQKYIEISCRDMPFPYYSPVPVQTMPKCMCYCGSIHQPMAITDVYLEADDMLPW